MTIRFRQNNFFIAVQLKRKPHAQYGLQIFPKTQRKAWTKIVRQGKKNDQNIDFLVSLGSPGVPWVSLGPLGIPWGPLGSPRVPGDPLGSGKLGQGVCVCVFMFVRVCVCALCVVLVCMWMRLMDC